MSFFDNAPGGRLIGWVFPVFVLGPLIFFLSYLVLGYYIYGDQYHYINFYNALSGTKINEVSDLQRQYTGSSEPLYGMMMWLASNVGWEKGVIISFANSLLSIFLWVSLRKRGVPVFVLFFLLTNYYFVVLLTAAERLKFSYLFVFMGMVFAGRVPYFFYAMAPAAHFQSLVNYFSYLSASLFSVRISDVLKKRSVFEFLGMMFGVALFFLFSFFFFVGFMEPIFHKFQVYNERADGEIYKLLIVLFLGLIVCKKKLIVFGGLLPIFLAALLVGPERVNMIGFVMLMYFVVQERKANHPLVIMLLAYFSWKSFGFVESIVETGSGFST